MTLRLLKGTVVVVHPLAVSTIVRMERHIAYVVAHGLDLHVRLQSWGAACILAYVESQLGPSKDTRVIDTC